MMRWLAAVGLLTLGGLVAWSQTPEPFPEVFAQYSAERDAAQKRGAPAALLATAAQLATEAETAQKAGNNALAMKLVRDARWVLPGQPLNLPDDVVRVIGYVKLRHADRVNALAYTPDGRLLISASRDGTARVWDLANGQERLTYRGHLESGVDDSGVKDQPAFRVPAVAISPDGATVASTGNGEIHLWELRTGQLRKKWNGLGRLIRGLAWSRDGKALITGGDDKIVRLWSVEKGQQTAAFPAVKSRIESLAVSTNQKLIAVVDGEGQLTVFKMDGTDPKPLLTAQVNETVGQPTFSVHFTPDDAKLFTAGTDQNPRLVTGPAADGTVPPGTGSIALRFPGHTGRVFAAAITRDGRFVATGGEDKSIRVWDTVSGKMVRDYYGLGTSVTAVTIRPDGQQLAAASEDGTIKLWDLRATDEHRASSESQDFLWATAISPDGKSYASGGADRIVRVYETTSGKLLHQFREHTGAITSLSYLTNEQLASASGDRTVRLWNLTTGKAQTLTGHASAVLALANHGKLLVTGGVDKSVQGWDAGSGKAAWSWTGRSAVAALAVRPNGSQVAVGTADGWLVLLDVSGTEPKAVGTGLQAHVAGVAAIAFSPDGRRVATAGGDGKLLFWTVEDDGSFTRITRDDPTRRPPITGTNALSTVAFSPDGRFAVSAGADTTLHLWDTLTGTETRTFRGHQDWVTSVTFSPNGEKLVSVGVDKTVRLFELKSFESKPLPGHLRAARAVAISRDGKTLASASEDQTVKLWELATGKELATLTGASETLFTLAWLGENEVAAGGRESRVLFWPVKPPHSPKNRPAGETFVVVGSEDGTRLAVWSRNANGHFQYDVMNFQAAAGEPIVDVTWKATCATFSSDLGWAISGDEDGRIRQWDLIARNPIGTDWALFTKSVADVALTADKKTLVAIDSDGLVKIATLANRETLKSFPAMTGSINGLMMAPQGSVFAVFNAQGEVKLFDLQGQLRKGWKLPSTPNGVAFTPDARQLVTANADGTMTVLRLP